jgi:DNA-binding CsgD family transcriptional regulator
MLILYTRGDMDILFISDNHYLCFGVESENIRALIVNNHEEVDKLLPFAISEDTIIIAIKNETLLRKCIRNFTCSDKSIIIMLREIDRGAYFKIRNLTYSSMIFDELNLNQLTKTHKKLRGVKFTTRELEVLYRTHLANTAIARQMNISSKTSSAYNKSIQNKIRITSKNTIARLKVKSLIVENFHAPYIIKN